MGLLTIIRKNKAKSKEMRVLFLCVARGGREGEVGARLQFVGSPVRQFLGWTPKESGGGEKVTFTDNVFYKFEGGKIKEVWNIVDAPMPL